MDVKERYKEICRACMKKERTMKKIFNSEINAVPISQMLSFATPINVRPDDGLPSSICYFCLNRLIGAYKFQQMCIDSDLQMRSALKEFNKTASPDILEEIRSGVQEGIPIDSFDEQDDDDDDDINDDEVYEILSIPPATNTQNKQGTATNQHNKQNNVLESGCCNIVNNVDTEKLTDGEETGKTGKDLLQSMVLKFECEDEDVVTPNQVKSSKQQSVEEDQQQQQTTRKRNAEEGGDEEEEILFTIETKGERDWVEYETSNASSNKIKSISFGPSIPKISSAVSLAPQSLQRFKSPSVTSNHAIKSNRTSSVSIVGNESTVKRIFNLPQTVIPVKTRIISKEAKQTAINRTITAKTYNVTNKNLKIVKNMTEKLSVQEENKSIDSSATEITIGEKTVTTEKKDDIKMKIVAYVCNICKMVFADKERFATHKKLKCPRSQSASSDNVVQPQQQFDYKCNQCKCVFDFKKDLDRHLCSIPIQRQELNKNLQSVQRQQQQKLIRTVFNDNRKENPEKATLNCNDRDYDETNTTTVASKHDGLASVITEKKKLNCNKCKMVWNSWSDLNNHLNKHKMAAKPKTLKYHTCNLCKKSYNSWPELNKHLSEHRKVMTAAATNESTTTSSSSSSSSGRHSCNFCTKTFNTYSDLSEHLNEHPIKVVYGTDSRSNPSVNISVNIHTADNSFKCDRCEKGFTSHDEILQHLPEHEHNYSTSRLSKSKQANCINTEYQQSSSGAQSKSPNVSHKIYDDKQKNTTMLQMSNSSKQPSATTNSNNIIEVVDLDTADDLEAIEICDSPTQFQIENEKQQQQNVKEQSSYNVQEFVPLQRRTEGSRRNNDKRPSKRSKSHLNEQTTAIDFESEIENVVTDYSKDLLSKCDSHCECIICQEDLNPKTFIENYKIYAASGNLFKCHKCCKMFYGLDILQKHMKTHDNNDGVRQQQSTEVSSILLPEIRLEKCENYDGELISFDDSPEYTENPIDINETDPIDIDGQSDFMNNSSHIDNSTISKKFQCNVCGLFLSTTSGLERHKQRWHSEKTPYYRYMCLVCGKGFKAKENLTRHEEKHQSKTDVELASFEIQDIKSINPNFDTTIDDNNSATIPNNELYNGKSACEYCDYSCNSRSSLRRHIRSEHKKRYEEYILQQIKKKEKELHEENLSNLICNICDREFDEPYLLQQHIERHRQIIEDRRKKKAKNQKKKINVELDESPKHSRCELCGKAFHKDDIRQHIMSVHCVDDDKNPKKRKSENISIREQSNDARSNNDKITGFNCPICGNESISSDMLKRHLRVVHVNSGDILKENLIMDNIEGQGIQFKCNLCSIIFHSFASLLRHKKVNHYEKDTKEKKEQWYQCPTCNKKFYVKSNFESHKKIHEPVNNFLLTSVESEERKQELQEDDSLTDGSNSRIQKKKQCIAPDFSQPHRCMICKCVCPNRQAFSRHLRKLHKKHIREKVPQSTNQHQCHICTRVLTSNYKLKSHLRRHIPDLNELGREHMTVEPVREPESSTAAEENVISKFQAFCKLCKKPFSSNTNTKRHLVAVHHKKKSECHKLIGLTAKTGSHYNRSTLVKCKYCSKLCQGMAAYSRHVVVHQDARWRSKPNSKSTSKSINNTFEGVAANMTLDAAPASNSQSTSLAASSALIDPNTDNVCKICGNIFFKQADLKRHLIMKHRKLVEEQRNLANKTETTATATANEPVSEQQQQLPPAKKMKLTDEADCEQQQSSMTPARKAKSIREPITILPVFVCKICGRKFNRQAHLNGHQEVHIKGYSRQCMSTIRCTICNKFLKEKSTIYHFKFYHAFKEEIIQNGEFKKYLDIKKRQPTIESSQNDNQNTNDDQVVIEANLKIDQFLLEPKIPKRNTRYSGVLDTEDEEKINETSKEIESHSNVTKDKVDDDEENSQINQDEINVNEIKHNEDAENLKLNEKLVSNEFENKNIESEVGEDETVENKTNTALEKDNVDETNVTERNDDSSEHKDESTSNEFKEMEAENELVKSSESTGKKENQLMELFQCELHQNDKMLLRTSTPSEMTESAEIVEDLKENHVETAEDATETKKDDKELENGLEAPTVESTGEKLIVTAETD